MARAETIAVSLKAMEGVYSQLVREHPATLLDVTRTARLGFPDVVFPDVLRNDIYVKLWSATFTPFPATTGSLHGRKSLAAGNSGDVQISVEVRKADGTTVTDAIHAGGSGEPPMSTYHSVVFHNNDHPTYGEMLKISLDRRLTECHLFLSFRSRHRDRPATLDPHELEKPFAFAYLPLMTTSTCLKDGVHDLVLYKMEKNLHPSPKLYYNAPHTSIDDPNLSSEVARNMTPLRDRVTLRSYLCSSMHTTDENLRRLLLDRQELVTDLNQLSETLQLFNFVSEEEIAKFVPATLDALFGFMVANLGDRQDEVDDAVFKALVKVLTMTSDRRFPNFNAVLDIYIMEKFTFSASSFRLLRAMKSTMSDPSTKDYRAFIKVWHLIFRFVIRGRALDKAKGIGLDATSAHIEADFKRQTKGILNEIIHLMQSTDKALIGTQTLAVQHYADILPSLSQVFPPLEIAETIISFADTLAQATGSIAIHKLFLLLQVVRSTFDIAEARALLVPAMIRWIRPHLGRFDDSRDVGDNQKTRDAKKIKWLECSRIAVTVSSSREPKLTNRSSPGWSTSFRSGSFLHSSKTRRGRRRRTIWSTVSLCYRGESPRMLLALITPAFSGLMRT
jgi:dedicator of cytokinesis protein 3